MKANHPIHDLSDRLRAMARPDASYDKGALVDAADLLVELECECVELRGLLADAEAALNENRIR